MTQWDRRKGVPHPERFSTSPEASADLWSDAWTLATKFVKRRQRVQKPRNWTSKHLMQEAFTVVRVGAKKYWCDAMQRHEGNEVRGKGCTWNKSCWGGTWERYTETRTNWSTERQARGVSEGIRGMNDTVSLMRNLFQRNRMPHTCGTKIGHVRVCGGSGWVTARFYPALVGRRLLGVMCNILA
jgi:hypothetical protein